MTFKPAMNRLPAALIAVAATICMLVRGHGAERPNIVWIVSEDNSQHYLRHFFEGGAPAPHIELLASQGLTFKHAFSNGAVCSVARTSLATGCYAPRIGTQFHRRYKLASMPEGLKMFPAYLRDAGYYTTNRSKKDYNAIEGKGVWDDSSNKAGWRGRKDAFQPFFHMESHAQSHEGSLHFSKQVFENEKTATDPSGVKLADYHPDTPLFRYTHARYLDRMRNIDDLVGETVAKLEKDGLLEDTFVFYFGDHGGVLPRGKGYLYDSGIHVPLVVRVPKNFAHLVDAKPGVELDGFVSFVDFGPTALNLAGVDVPKQVGGRPFLGKGVSAADLAKRDETFGYADRFDEKYDFVRTIRKGRYQYIRNFQPWLPDGLQNNYRYKMLAYQEWRRLFEAGMLNEAQARFYQAKPVEALYDVEADPHEVRNLAADPKYAEVLAGLRGELRELLLSMPDLSYYPESYLLEHAMDDPAGFGQKNRLEIKAMADIADLALGPFSEARPKLIEALGSDNWAFRYWAVMTCSAFGKEASEMADAVKSVLKDKSPLVRLRAIEFIGLLGEVSPQPLLSEIVNSTNDPVLATEILNSVVWFRDFFEGRYPVARSDFSSAPKGADVADRLDYIGGNPGSKGKSSKKKKR